MNFGIRGNIYKPEISHVISGLIRYFNEKNIRYYIDNSLKSITQVNAKLNSSARKKFVSTAKLLSLCDFIISIGGDGTFLYTASKVSSSGIPIIGANLGKLGFLAEIPASKITVFINDVLKGKYLIEERTVLQAHAAGRKKTLYGINEIVINQSGMVKTIEITVYYNDQPVNSYHADGLIVATPTGSTGYSLSAGGPIVHPSTKVMILCPLSPHTLTARPVILPDDGIFRVKVTSRIPIYLIADGNSSIKLSSPAEIFISKAPYRIKIAKPLTSNYFKILRTKLLWGEDKRKKAQRRYSVN